MTAILLAASLAAVSFTFSHALSSVYDESVWTRQWHSFKIPFPAKHVLHSVDVHASEGISSQTGPYDVAFYAADGEAGGYSGGCPSQSIVAFGQAGQC